MPPGSPSCPRVRSPICSGRRRKRSQPISITGDLYASGKGSQDPGGIAADAETGQGSQATLPGHPRLLCRTGGSNRRALPRAHRHYLRRRPHKLARTQRAGQPLCRQFPPAGPAPRRHGKPDDGKPQCIHRHDCRPQQAGRHRCPAQYQPQRPPPGALHRDNRLAHVCVRRGTAAGHGRRAPGSGACRHRAVPVRGRQRHRALPRMGRGPGRAGGAGRQRQPATDRRGHPGRHRHVHFHLRHHRAAKGRGVVQPPLPDDRGPVLPGRAALRRQ